MTDGVTEKLTGPREKKSDYFSFRKQSNKKRSIFARKKKLLLDLYLQ